MFLNQFFSNLWMFLPVFLVGALRVYTPVKRWSFPTLWSLGIGALLSVLFFGLQPMEVLLLPDWTGILPYGFVLLLWLLFGQICLGMGRIGGVSPKWEPFLYGTLCGCWASAHHYRGMPRKLGMSLGGALLGRIGVPVLVLFPQAHWVAPVALLLGVIFSTLSTEEEERLPTNQWLWGICGVVWLISWFDPVLGLSLGCVIGFAKQRRVRGIPQVLLFWIFGVYISSMLAGIGLLELCARYMEGGVLGVQSGLAHDIFWFGFIVSIVADPIVAALCMQGLWDRALDVQHLQLVQGLFLSACIGQAVFSFVLAGCLNVGKRELMLFIIVSSGYIYAWEVF